MIKWIGIIFGGVIAIALVANAINVYRTDVRLEQQIEAIREAGDPVTLADLVPKPIPPEDNAAVFLRRADDDINAIEEEVAEIYEIEDYTRCQLGQAELKTIQSALEAYPKVIPLLKQAAACKDYVPQIKNVDSVDDYVSGATERISKPRAAIRVLHLQTILLLSQEKSNEALETCVVMLRLSRHLQREPGVVGHLVALACRGTAIETANRVLRSGPVSEEARNALEAELSRCDDVAAYRRALKTERVVMMEGYRTLPGRRFWLYLKAKWNADETASLEMIDRLLGLASKPYSATVQDKRLDPKKARTSTHVMAALALPAMISHRQALARVTAQTRSLRVLSALQRRANQNGDDPQLADLGLPEEMTTDPYTDKPLQLKKTVDGWIVYSVGENFKDDGGDLKDRRDVGLGPVRFSKRPSEPSQDAEEDSSPTPKDRAE